MGIWSTSTFIRCLQSWRLLDSGMNKAAFWSPNVIAEPNRVSSRKPTPDKPGYGHHHDNTDGSVSPFRILNHIETMVVISLDTEKFFPLNTTDYLIDHCWNTLTPAYCVIYISLWRSQNIAKPLRFHFTASIHKTIHQFYQMHNTKPLQ